MVYPKNILPSCGLKISILPTWGKLCLSPITTSIKNRGKFVFLLLFYVFLLSKHKKPKKKKKIKRKKKSKNEVL